MSAGWAGRGVVSTGGAGRGRGESWGPVGSSRPIYAMRPLPRPPVFRPSVLSPAESTPLAVRVKQTDKHQHLNQDLAPNWSLGLLGPSSSARPPTLCGPAARCSHPRQRLRALCSRDAPVSAPPAAWAPWALNNCRRLFRANVLGDHRSR